METLRQLGRPLATYAARDAAIVGLIAYAVAFLRPHQLTASLAKMSPDDQDVVHDFLLKAAREGINWHDVLPKPATAGAPLSVAIQNEASARPDLGAQCLGELIGTIATIEIPAANNGEPPPIRRNALPPTKVWAQPFIHLPAGHGMGGFVLAHSSMSSNQFGDYPGRSTMKTPKAKTQSLPSQRDVRRSHIEANRRNTASSSRNPLRTT